MKANKSNYRSAWVAYVGPFGFPDGGAAARRVLGNAQSLVEAGYRVVVASGQQAGLMQDSEFGEGITVVSLGERTAEHWPRPIRRMRYAAMGLSTRAWLQAQAVPPTVVILYSGYTPYLLRLIPWCRRMEIPLIFDAVEWYEAIGPFGWLVSPYQWNIELAMRWLVKKTDGVIAISSYLSDYYRAAGLPVINVPPTLALDEIPDIRPPRDDDRLHLCYAGLPTSNKDLIDVVVESVLNVDEGGRRLVLHVAGPDEEEVLKLPSLSGYSGGMPQCIQCYGMLPQSAAMSLVQSCDFTVLLRREQRVSKAGFSTKFVESMALGTPVIGNITGDLDGYLKDGETGLVCDGWSVEQLCQKLTEALAMPLSEIREMRHHSKEMATAYFDHGVYSDALASFIQEISHR